MTEQVYIVTRTVWEDGEIQYVSLDKAFRTWFDADKYVQEHKGEFDTSYEVCTVEF